MSGNFELPIVVGSIMQERRAADRAQTAAQSRGTQELAALEIRRGELKGQLSSITERRSLLSVQMRDSDPATARALTDRIKQLDDRTARIDNELNGIDDQISAMLARGVPRPPSGFEQLIRGMPGATPPPAPRFEFFGPRQDSGLMVNLLIGQGVGFLLLAFVLWRGLRRRVASGFAKLAPEDAGRLDQLQRSVDVMAVEVERISEGQRYVSKVLNDQQKLPNSL
jgi:hypothetical protein